MRRTLANICCGIVVVQLVLGIPLAIVFLFRSPQHSTASPVHSAGPSSLDNAPLPANATDDEGVHAILEVRQRLGSPLSGTTLSRPESESAAEFESAVRTASRSELGSAAPSTRPH